ncbi:hypothetical protein [Tritonibacter mobilis]|uniref:hypothetical protein n=1 Tax=Tritonibacter mobilis TaxID=379347 RepID=UPI000806A341|nr:hypothetical protein [Tritonibacter mobilis]
MPREKHYLLITVAGVRLWGSEGKKFQVRYDLVRAGQRNVSSVYNCIYLLDGREYMLVASGTRPDGSVQDRKISLWPGVLVKHHLEFGDGSQIIFNPTNQTISTCFMVDQATAKVSTVGRDLTRTPN